MSFQQAATYARRAQHANSSEEKLSLLAQAVAEMATDLAHLEQDIRSIKNQTR